MSELPSGWATTTLEELAEYITSGSRDWSKYYSNEGALFVRTQDINKNRLTSIESIARVDLPSKVEGKRTLILKDDILITITGANVGKCAVVEEPLPEAYVSQSVALVRLKDAELSRLIHRQLMTPTLQGGTILQQSAYGLGRPVLNLENVRRVPLLVPPKTEQRRILNKLDALLKRVDECREKLDRVPVILKKFRQAVLAAATSGTLTEDWREGGGVRLNEWKLVKLSDVADSRLGKMLDRSKNTGEPTPYLRNTNVRWFSFDLSDVQNIKISTKEVSQFSIKDRDVLVCEGGEPGRCAIWKENNTFYVYQKALHRVRVRDDLLPEYLCYSLKQAAESGTLASLFTGTTIKHLTGVALSRFHLNLPTIKEQSVIVQRVEKLFTYADRLEARYLAARKRVDQLTPALLAKAFRGELVEQDPNDEPASVLLERIKAELAQAASARGAAPKRSTSKVKQAKPATPIPVQEGSRDVGTNIPERLLAAMQQGREYARAEITAASGVSDAEWSWAIRQLKEEGKVCQTGEKRGARYSRS